MDNVIKKIADRFGEDILLESRKLSSLIDDYIPGDKKTANLLNAAIRNNVPKKLNDMKSLNEQDRDIKIKELCAQFAHDYAIAEKAAYPVVNQFAIAFKFQEVKFSAAKKVKPEKPAPVVQSVQPAAGLPPESVQDNSSESNNLTENPKEDNAEKTPVSENSVSVMDSRPEKKTEQDSLLELQMGVAKKARIPDILTIITGVFIILALTAAMFIIPDETFSEQENRALQQFPKLTENSFLDRLIDGRFTEEIADYYADQFPLRDLFVGLKGRTEIILLKGENDEVILGKENYLITKDSSGKSFDETRNMLIKNMDGIAEFADSMDEIKVNVTLAAAGRSIDVLEMYLPATYPRTASEDIWKSFNDLAAYYGREIKSFNGVDLYTPIKALTDRQDRGQLYYRTDHHWTTLGAYYAYAEIIRSFKEEDLEPAKLSEFNRIKVSDSFYGTTWSKAGMKWIEPDNIEYFRYDGDEDYLTEIKSDSGKILRTLNGFYDFDYLDKKDKYSSFISGNNSRVDITKQIKNGEPNRPKMLVIKDSFAHSVIPFLAYHYDLIILDYRYYDDSAANLIYYENIERVLFLHNISNLSESNIYGSFADEETENNENGEDIVYPGPLQYGVDKILEEYKRAQYPIRNIYINNNSIQDYILVVPTEENDTRGYYLGAAESLQAVILEKMGIELEIVHEDDWSELDKIITFTTEGLPALGFIRIATEGNNLVFRCNIDANSPGYAAGIFISKYLGKNATGSFNFGDDFVYSDIGNNVIMIRPS